MKYILFFLTTFCFSQQHTITGTITSNNRSIDNASVVVLDDSENMLGYTYSNNLGIYSIPINSKVNEKITISVSSLGYQKKEITVILSDKTLIKQSFELEEKAEVLNEVVLKTDQKIKIDSDTITIKTKYFTNDSEQTVEDVLKRIPGIEVEEDGTIKANGKRIEKLLLEGDDLFDKDYKLLSKNLDGKVLDAVQILKNFEDNPILKSLGDSDAVAVNLKLKKNILNIWFGNLTLGAGVVSENRWKESLNIGLIRKKIKLLNLADYNNSGTKATDQISKSFPSFDIYRQDRFEKETRNTFNSFSGENTTFSDTQSIFNDAFFNTLAFNTKIKPNLSLRSVSYFALDEQIQNSFNATEYLVNPTISLTEQKNYSLQNKKIGGEIELKYSGNPKNYITANIIFKNKPTRINDNIFFNNDLVNVASKNNNYSFYNHLYHTFKMGHNKVLINYLYFGKDHLTEKNNISSPFLNTFFNANTNAFIKEEVTNDIIYTGFKSKLITKYNKKAEHVIAVRLETNTEKNKNDFLVSTNLNPAYTNNLTLKQNILGLENGFKYEFTEDFKFNSTVKLDVTNYDTNTINETNPLLNTFNSLSNHLKKIGTISISHSYNNSLPSITSLIENYQLTGYRNFSKGINQIPILKSNTFSISHGNNSVLKRFFLFTDLSYTKTATIQTQESTITNNFVFNNTVFTNGGDSYRLLSNIKFFIRKIQMATKLETQQTWINSPVKVNTTEFSTINTLFSTYSFSGTTYLEKPYNFDFTVTQNRSYTTFNDTRTTNVITKANASVNYKFSETFIAELKSDFYWLDQNYSFLNTVFNYTPKKSRFAYRLTLNNLFNVNEFKITSLNEFTINTRSIPLIERYALLTIRYRF